MYKGKEGRGILQSPHSLQPTRHGLDMLAPLCVQLRVVEDGGDDTSTVSRRVGVVTANQDGQLRLDVTHVVGCIGHQRQVARTLIIQAKVLGKALCTDEF